MQKLTDTKLESIIRSKILICSSAFPCHTQAVEQTVKLATDASQKVIGSKQRWVQ